MERAIGCDVAAVPREGGVVDFGVPIAALPAVDPGAKHLGEVVIVSEYSQQRSAIANMSESNYILVFTTCADLKYVEKTEDLLHILHAEGRFELRDQFNSAVIPK